ncbi:MAG: hypothetical protein HYX88_01420 [Chloroflexi bacterium]|nr:hypothetical protein [Chloroflexota bacterium]
MDLNVSLPLSSTIISVIFALFVLDQFLERRKPYQLVWTIGLLWYATSAFTEFYGNSQGWNETVYRFWYLIGAFFVAAYLGMGTIYLLTPRKFAHIMMALLLLGSIYAILKVFTASVDAALLPQAGEVVTGKALPGSVRILTPFFNIFGAGALVLGAIYSAWIFWRRRILPHRVISNIIIAVGAFIPSITSGISRFGMTGAFFLGEMLGVLIIFVGFLISIEVFEQFKIPFTRVTLGAHRSQV